LPEKRFDKHLFQRDLEALATLVIQGT
jgi:hypothetical protein